MPNGFARKMRWRAGRSNGVRTAFESPDRSRAGARGSIEDGAGDEIVRSGRTMPKWLHLEDALTRRAFERRSSLPIVFALRAWLHRGWSG